MIYHDDISSASAGSKPASPASPQASQPASRFQYRCATGLPPRLCRARFQFSGLCEQLQTLQTLERGFAVPVNRDPPPTP